MGFPNFMKIRIPHFRMPGKLKLPHMDFRIPKLPHINFQPRKIFDTVKNTFNDALKVIGEGASTVTDKLKVIEDLMDRKTAGIAGTLISVALPEVALTEASAKVLKDVGEGKSLQSSLGSVATTLAYTYLVKNESEAMRLGVSAFANSNVQRAMSNTTVGRMIIDKIKNRLPPNIGASLSN